MSTTTRHRPFGLVIAAVGIPAFMGALDNLVVSTALPVIRTELGASISDLQWFVNAYTLPFAAFLLTAAALGDRLGRRRVYLAGIALFTVASAAAALASEPWQLTAARAVQGIGGAAIAPLSLTLLAGAVPDRLRNAAVGIWGGITGLGVAVGPVVGGAVVDGLTWNWIFWVNVPIGVVALILAAVVLDESRGGARRLDPLGLLLSAGGMLLLIWGIVDGPDRGWTTGRVPVMLVGGVTLLAGFLLWQVRNRTPMLPLTLFRSRSFSLVNVVSLTFSAGAFGSVFLLAQFFQVTQGLSPLESGLRTLPWTAAPMIVAPLAGIFGARLGVRNLVVAGQFLLAAGLLWVGLVLSTDAVYIDFIGAFLLAGIGMGLTFAPISTITLASVSAQQRGVASGTNNTVREFGVAAGVAALSSVFSTYGGFANPQDFVDGAVPGVLVGAAILTVGALVAVLLPRDAAIPAAAPAEPIAEPSPAL
ncbi:DHA2 family efflux MFS transporter permease subunit [Actinoplanes derwentensis]|uniref:Drug resistance transporter, EmrB/QacA subfamily n=1 Tax=Actinoplanes derwentensis TaxID=113562 RepID=A0A1H1ZZU6_9ACTN|nr:DHA2 family efflux MFS transporter permease subunit [Actinoplanes derwentensis]GID83453.1 MFS transporter [Actinoplanes derwentensis]SDT39203.1 drug resistance transporter, EmrB/QacA subfamily [Actinoplanes derwentensis]